MSNLIDLGHIRISNKHVIQLKSYDPYPETGRKTYRISSDRLWFPHVNYKVGEWVTYYDINEPTYYNGVWNAVTNTPTLQDSNGLLTNTYYIVSHQGSVDFGNGIITFDQGDLVVYNGTKWVKKLGSQNSYICIEDHWADASFDDTKWIKNDIPSFYRLDINSGVLYATIDYIPVYSRTYNFYARIDKTDRSTGQVEFINQQFKLVVRGPIDNDLTFVTDSNLGSINRGYLSELSIIAKHENQQIGYTTEIVSGLLPDGLELSLEGSIYGRAIYMATLGEYQFTVRAKDSYGQSIEKQFTLNLTDYDGNKYTQIFVKPFLQRSYRNLYLNFISDTNIFQRSMLYRPDDPNFGVQYDIKLYLEYGIQQATLNEYVLPLKNYFYRKKLWFGNVETTQARDSIGNHIYDVVYVNIVDPLSRTLPFQISSNPTTFPNSIEHMRNSLETMIVNGSTVKIDEFLRPLWMRSVQPASGIPVGYKPVVVLCYCKPGMGLEIINNINQNGFEFNNIDFEIDRLIVENNLTVGETTARDNSIIIASDGSIVFSKYDVRPQLARYLIFPRSSHP